VVGPNGAGKSTLFERVIGPVTHLEFVNANVIAKREWPGDELAHTDEASVVAPTARFACRRVRGRGHAGAPGLAALSPAELTTLG